MNGSEVESVPLRILRHGPLSGEQNMAVDGEMLEAAVQGAGTLRFYRWEQPTVSLGHFQSRDGDIPARFADCPVVRRLSGGGAILHDRELTYSIALPAGHAILQPPTMLYDRVHAVILRVLAEFGVTATLRGDRAFEDQSFLCFARGDQRDILIGDHKIVGSAQRRRSGAVLQHGSILLETSPLTPEFPGIKELSGTAIEPVQLADRLQSELEQVATS